MITATGAKYIVKNLPYGKYRTNFSINDNKGNRDGSRRADAGIKIKKTVQLLEQGKQPGGQNNDADPGIQGKPLIGLFMRRNDLINAIA